MKLPVNGQWKVIQDSDKGVQLMATKNIDFNRGGLAALSERVVALFDTDDDADFGIPLASYYNGGEIIRTATDDEMFVTDLADGLPSTTQDVPGFGDTPNPTLDSGAVYFNNEWVLTEPTGFCTFSAGATAPWTRRTLSPALVSGYRHPAAVNFRKSPPSIVVGNGNTVQQYSTSWVTGSFPQLVIPTGYEVTGIAYNRAYMGIVTWNNENREAHFYIWDSADTSANFAYPMGSNRAYFVVPYQDTFVVLTGNGQLLKWTTVGLEQLAALPSYYTTATLGDVNDSTDVSHDTSYRVDGDRILFNLGGTVAQKNSEVDTTNPTQPSGVWCYDPKVGLYHRHAPSSSKLFGEVVATGDVNTTTDIITLDAVTCPETGTEVVYMNNGGTTLAGLTNGILYYTIYVSDTTMKLALSRSDAAAGTAIDLTGTGNDLQTFQFLPAWDYGQYYNVFGGLLTAAGGPQQYEAASSYVFGAGSIPVLTLAGSKDALCATIRFGENRGWMMTQKMFSPNVTEHWSKLYVKARGLKTENDKVIVKYRSTEDTAMPVYATEQQGTLVTWTDSTTFTTTYDISDVQVGYEVEFIGGAGSGYTAHVVSNTESGGTYTVVIDETIRNISASDKAFCIFDNWLKLGTEMDSTSDKNYTEYPIAKTSKWIQFKIELRGRNVAIEELELINTKNKAAA